MARRSNDVFYAFPSDPPDLAETIESAAKILKQDSIIKNEAVRIRPWPDMRISGRQLISTITDNIKKADVFACDLTYPNNNVTFELAYAIGQIKRLWISLNPTIVDAEKNYRRSFATLLGVGYSKYENHQQLASNFSQDAPWRDTDKLLLGEMYRRPGPRQEQPSLLYVKPAIETDAVVNVQELLMTSAFSNNLIIDNPKDNPSPSLEWYAEKIRFCDAVIVHMLSSTQYESTTHNIKTSFVAGLTKAFGKPIIMLAHEPFVCPIDYQDVLKTHATAQQCTKIVTDWITVQEGKLPRRRARRPQESYTHYATLDLRGLSIGDSVAEHEHEHLDKYFVETAAYYKAYEDKSSILIGRRGTGKTATLYSLAEAQSGDRANHVCVVKPVGYETDGLVRVLQENIHRSEKGYLVESLWKFLIYTELAASVYHEIMNRPVHIERQQQESTFLEFCETNSGIISIPFSQRLDGAIRPLLGISGESDPAKQRVLISEKLHSGELQKLRELLGLVLERRKSVVILVDNLDEPWIPGGHIEELSILILGLLRVTEDITEDFKRQVHWRKAVNVRMTVFLRSDIFSHIQPLAAEQDKWPIHRVVWNDSELLRRVINERLLHSAPPNLNIEDIWDSLFPSEVVGLQPLEFILNTTLQRPRDVIYFVREAISTALNRGHQTVTQEDMLDARRKYSEYVFRSILSEDDPRRGKMEDVLFEFAGVPRQISRSQLHNLIMKARVESSDVDFYVDLLCDVNFLGIQAADGFQYAEHEGDRHMLREVAIRLADSRDWGEESYQINPAFYQVLQID